MKIYLLAYLFVLVYCAPLNAQDTPTPTPQWRPVYHFTPLKNWTNDPNGLLYVNGVYHLYNQQNPFENKWGHMSWGHATSKDLIHWTHLPVAIPETIDKDTTWRFSGCAVLDKNNTGGFGKDGHTMVAIYTADQPNLKKESQFIAYSNDGGITFTNYVNNPVIDLGRKDFRDPNVAWNEQLQKWLMVVALPTEHKVNFYTSANLKNWDLLSEFGSQGFTGAAWECPSFIQLPVNDDTKTKWVLFVSAAGGNRGTFMQYFTGDFDGKTFTNDNKPETVLTVDDGDCLYAAIPWNDAPGNKKTLIGWMVPDRQYTFPWRGQMSIPRDLGLVKTTKGLRLTQSPASMITINLNSLAHKETIDLSGKNINGEETILKDNQPAVGNCWWLDAVFIIKAGTTVGFKIAQETEAHTRKIFETIAGYNSFNGMLYVDKSASRNILANKQKINQVMASAGKDSTVRMQILLDKSSVEVFFNNGEKVITTHIFPGEHSTGLSVFSSGGTVTLTSFKLWKFSQLAGK